jgi:hypothetical protein
MVVTLEIKKADGSSYWTEIFNTKAECDKWIAEEKTRTYWNPGFVVLVDDKTSEVDEQNRVADAKLRELIDKRAALERYFKNLKRSDVTIENLPDIIMNIKKYILGDL